jgi:hypothetical protein
MASGGGVDFEAAVLFKRRCELRLELLKELEAFVSLHLVQVVYRVAR